MPNKTTPISPGNRPTKPWPLALKIWMGSNLALYIFSIFGQVHYITPLHVGLAATAMISSFVLVFPGVKKSIFGQESLKPLKNKEGKITLIPQTKKGLLDMLGYHNPYSRVSVDKVIKDVLPKDIISFAKLAINTRGERTLISERTLALLKDNKERFPESEKSKINASYVNKVIETKFAV